MSVKKRVVEGVSELYVDLILTLIVLSISGTLIASVSAISRNSNTEYNNLSIPLAYAILLNSSSGYLIILCNYGDDELNYAVLVNNSLILRISVTPHSFAVVPLNTTSVSAGSVTVLVNDEVMIKPQVIEA